MAVCADWDQISFWIGSTLFLGQWPDVMNLNEAFPQFAISRFEVEPAYAASRVMQPNCFVSQPTVALGAARYVDLATALSPRLNPEI